MVNKPEYKISIIAPTCFYYQVPLFRQLADSPMIDLTVYFCSEEGSSGDDARVVYGADAFWGVEDSLLDGYKFKFLRNYAPWGSYLKSLVGLANFGIWSELLRERPDAVVIMSWMNPTWWITVLACLRFKIPFMLMTDANVAAEKTKSQWKSWIKGILLGKFLFKLTDGFLCAGVANRQLYIHYNVPEAKLVPFAYSWGYNELLEQARNLTSKRADLRKQYKLPLDSFVILYCGRLSSEKGILDLLKAYELVNNPNKALVIVGTGQQRNALEQFVNEHDLDQVYFMGFQPRSVIGHFYGLADLLVLPSHLETWGIVVNEALCFSLPIIVSDQVGAGIELVIPHENGFVFPVADFKTLASQIECIIDLPNDGKLMMREKSRELISEWSKNNLGGSLTRYLDSMYRPGLA